MDDVCERLTEYGYLDASEINVEVNEGEITLTGYVQDRKAKRLAEEIADSVFGVRDIHNRLELPETPEQWTDRVGRSGVYPASGGSAPKNAEAQGMASWGQGERGAEGYHDHGDSELRIDRVDEDKS